MKTIVFIDYANIKAWAKNKGLLVDLKILHVFLKNNLKADQILFYYGTDPKNSKSMIFLEKVKTFGYKLVTKQVQYFHVDLKELFNKPINREILQRMSIKGRKSFLEEIEKMSKLGTKILYPKANFDVEITMDMLLAKNDFDTFVLFSGDGDFAPLVSHLMLFKKPVIVISGRKFLSGRLLSVAKEFVTLEKFSEDANGTFYKMQTPPFGGA